MQKITQDELVELIGAFEGVDGIASEDSGLFIHVQDTATRDEIGAYLQKLKDEEDLDFSNVHIRL